jgi:rhamnosyltransferase
MLSTQEYPVGKIIIVNTEKKYLDESSIQVPNVEVHHIRKEEFDHGATRRLGISFSQADFFLLMTDDAVPADAFLVSRLAAVLRGDPEAASVYARQLPTEESSEDERLAREFNYPGVSRRKTRADLPALGIKTYFGSNVCCMYRRSIYDSLGGFVSRTIFNEDMLYQAAAIQAGYAVHYCAEAEVFHAHHSSGKETLIW